MMPHAVSLLPSSPSPLMDKLAAAASVRPLVLTRAYSLLNGSELAAAARNAFRSPLLEWDFGPVMEMKFSADAQNYLFSREEVPFHWDGAFHKEPRFLVFNCIEAPPVGSGGETLFHDTEALWNSLSNAEREKLSRIVVTYETEKVAHYGGRIEVPLVQKHPVKNVTTIRYAEPVESTKNPVRVSVHGFDGDLISFMKERLYDSRFLYTHVWQRGDLLIADNFSLLHARRPFDDDAPRHLRRVQVL